jgi:hypothetical protein
MVCVKPTGGTLPGDTMQTGLHSSNNNLLRLQSQKKAPVSRGVVARLQSEENLSPEPTCSKRAHCSRCLMSIKHEKLYFHSEKPQVLELG